MNISEFIAKYPSIWLRHETDRDILKRNVDGEVIAYAVSRSGTRAFSYVFIFKGKKKLMAISNGAQSSPEDAYNYIQQMQLEKLDSEEARKQIFMKSV
jgi:hypothetical protein